MSGIGPIQGQHFWFKFFHSVKDLDQSVYDRYRNECYRVFAVLEKQLEKHEWIAIDRFTVAGGCRTYYTCGVRVNDSLLSQIWPIILVSRLAGSH